MTALALSCSEEPPMEPEIEMDNMDYPKVFGNAEIIVRQADIYSQVFGQLTYHYTVYFEPDTSDNYTITLLSPTTLSESYFGDVTDYELLDSCLIDFRTFRKLTIHEEGTSLTFETLSVGTTDFAWLPIDFDCLQTEDEIISDAIRRLADVGAQIDTIRLDRFMQRVELIQ